MQVKRFDFTGKFNLLVVFWLSLSLVTPVIHWLGYNVPDFIGRVFFTALAVLAFAVTHKMPLLTVSIAGFLAAAAAVSYQVAPHFLSKIYNVLLGPRSPDAYLWPLAIIAAVTLIFYIFLFKLKNPLPLLLIIGLASFVPLWYLYIDSAYPAAVSYTICWLMYLSYKSGARLWSKVLQTKQDHEEVAYLRQGWIGYTVLVLSLALLLTLILPKSFAPVHWAALHNWAGEVFPFFSELRGNEEENVRGDGGTFGFYSSGLQETTRLDGPLRRDPTVLLEVRGRGGVYLKGSVFDSYTGSSWANTGSSAVSEDFPDPPAALSDYLLEIELKVRHRRLRTNTVFSILYPMEFTGLPWMPQVDRNSGITLPRSLPLRREYSVKGFIQAYRADIAALEKEEEPPELEAFLELPADLPARVKDLALEITAGRQGYYEKMKALELYLRVNYSYNTETTLLPGDMDFVDFFLFDSREGYCTYFATALAVMGRAAGVPTRYVVGFKVPVLRSEGGIYEVAGTNAHAWIEAYIPGVGWLPFEPTPGYSTPDSLPLRRDPSDGIVSPPGENDLQVPTPVDGDLPGIYNGYPFPFIPREDGMTGERFFSYLLRVLLVVALAALAIFSLVMLYRYRRIKRSISELDRQTPRLRAAGYYNLTLSLLGRLETGKYPGETPREYSRRIIHDVYTWDLNFKEISEGINLALYSKHGETPPTLAEKAERFFLFIFDRYLAQVGRWTAFLEILVQGKFFGKRSKRRKQGNG